MLHYVLLVLGLVLLIKGADWLVRGASSIARSFQVSDLVIGLTVVSFGTSLPELVIGIVAGLEDSTDIVIGNVVGSNIANILLVLGVAAMIYPLRAKRKTITMEIPFTLLASVVLVAMLNDTLLDGDATPGLSHVDGILLLCFFMAFLYYIANAIKSDQAEEWLGEPVHDSRLKSTIEIVGGLAGVVVGGHLTVTAATAIATAWGMSEVFIGLTVIAVGTSLPELATSAVAAYRKNADIAVGNVVGSNIFNIFMVLGVSSVVKPVPFNTANNTDLGVMIFATLLLFFALYLGRTRKIITRVEGATFVLVYAIYTGYLIWRG